MTSPPTTRRPPSVERYGVGEVIVFPGTSDHLYRVHEGLVRLHMVDTAGTGLTLRYVKPGGYFGEESLAAPDATERRYYAETLTPCSVELIDPSTLDDDERLRLDAYLADTMQRLYLGLFRRGGMRLRSRIAAELLELSDSPLASVDDRGRAVVRITHDDLAAAVGSVRETITKVVGELVRADAIDPGYGKIVLRDVDALTRIAGERR